MVQYRVKYNRGQYTVMRGQGVNPHHNKLINLRRILGIIAKHGVVAQTDITQQTHLTKQAISNLVQTLKQTGFIETITGEKPFERKVGKPSTLLQLSDNSMYTIGIRLRKHSVESALYNIKGDCVYVHKIPLQSTSSQHIIACTYDIYTHILNHCDIPHKQIIGMGMVLPPYRRLVDTQSAFQYTDALALQNRIQQGVFDTTGVPVIMENIATSLATKELFWGSAKHLQSFIYIYIGYSVQAGFIHQKRVLSGFEGMGGQFGHLIVAPDGIACACGNKGCLNTYVSLESLEIYLKKHHVSFHSVEAVLQHPDTYKKYIDAWLQQMSEYMRLGIHALETLFNAETIILGGVGSDVFMHQCTRMLRPLIPSVAQIHKRQIPRIINVKQEQNMIVKGAGTLPFYMALEPDPYYQGYKYHADYNNTPADRVNALLL